MCKRRAGITLTTLAVAVSSLCSVKFGETPCLSDGKDFCFHMTAVVPIKSWTEQRKALIVIKALMALVTNPQSDFRARLPGSGQTGLWQVERADGSSATPPPHLPPLPGAAAINPVIMKSPGRRKHSCSLCSGLIIFTSACVFL